MITFCVIGGRRGTRLHTGLNSIRTVETRPPVTPHSRGSFLRGSRRKGLFAAALVFVGLSLLAWILFSDFEERRIAAARSEVQLAIWPSSNALVEALGRRIALLEGLRAFVEAEKGNPEFGKHFRIFAAGLHTGARGVRSFQVLPGGVIREQYPLENNEKALGLNLLQEARPEVREDAERAVASRRLTLGGPFELIQGGLALAAREAIFDGEKFWGLVAVIIDVPPLIEEAGLLAPGSQLKFALRDQKHRIFFGNRDVFDGDPVIQSVSLPEGAWDLAAVPERGWDELVSASLLIYRLAAGFLMLLLSGLTYFGVERIVRLSSAVRMGEREYRLVTDTVPALIAWIDKNQRYRFCNRIHQEWFAKSAGDFAGKSLLEVVGQSTYDEMRDHVEAVLRGRRVDFVLALPRPDQGMRRLSVTFAPRIGDEGHPDGFYVLAIDITDRVQVDEERDRLFTLSRDMLCIAGLDGYLKMINPAWERILGYTRQELLSRPFVELIHPEDQAATKTAMERLSGGRDVLGLETRYRCKDGTYKWILWNTAVMPGSHLVYGVARDITNRKQAEEALRTSEARLERAQSMASLGNWEVDLDTWALECSGEVYRIFGLDPTTSKPGRDEIMNFVYPADRESVRAAFQEAVAAGTPLNLDHRIVHLDGTVRHVRTRAEVIPGASGKVVRMIGTVQDITEYKRLEERFQQAQKLESVGRLAGGVAHDFNNLLTVINGYSELMTQRLDPGSPLRAYLGEIKSAGDRASSLTQQLLAFSRRQVMQPCVLDLNAVISELENMLRRLIGEDMELVTVFDPSLGKTMADAGQIHQVVMNLVVNGRDAMPDGGKLTIETANVELRNTFPVHGEKVQPGPYVMLAVSDTGVGMSEETKGHIFEPFFTTKAQGAGTGLGLSTVYGIISQSGGGIWVYSELGKGTTFKIYLPRVVEETADSEKSEPAASADDLRGDETILIVEDQDEVRSLARNVLELYGYRVLEASNAVDAMQLCERYAGTIHLLLTDVVMPGINGRELSERLSPLRPDMKVAYMSGYTDDMIIRRGVLVPDMAFIQKPFTPEALATKVREALGAPQRAGSILIVDDDEGVRKLLRQILSAEGYRVTEAADGLEARKYALEDSLDIVLTDLVMPGQEGLETIAMLHRERPHLKIIAMSGAFGGEFLKAAELMGARATLSKPIVAEKLLETVRKVMAA